MNDATHEQLLQVAFCRMDARRGADRGGSPNPPSELTWSRACLLALGWSVAGMVATGILAGLLNGLSLVSGQDMVETFWTGIFVAVGVMVASVSDVGTRRQEQFAGHRARSGLDSGT